MPVTYTVTEDNGHQHTRTSARDNAVRYTHAVVRFPKCGKHHVSYHSTEALARKALADAMTLRENNSWNRENFPDRIGKPMHPEAKIYPAVAVVKVTQKRRPA